MERAELVGLNGTLGRFLDDLGGNGPGEPRVTGGTDGRAHRADSQKALSSVFLSGMISR